MKFIYFAILILATGIFFAGCQKEEVVSTTPATVGVTTPEQILEGLVTSGSSKDGGLSIMSDQGCTRTQGYWKTHSIYGPAGYDATWELLPGGLGSNTPLFGLGKTWYQVFWTSPKGGNAYYILAHQFMAAALNWRAGAGVPTYVGDALQHAAVLLYTYDGTPYNMDAITGSVREDFINTKDILEEYNKGNSIGGPPHCTD